MGRMTSYMSNGHENITRNASSIPNIVTSRNKQNYVNQGPKYLTVYPFAEHNKIENNYQSYANLST